MTVTSLTWAPRGPFRLASIMAATASRAPVTSASTLPSLRFRTQPRSPRLAAVRVAQRRYPTPCTVPVILRRTVFSNAPSIEFEDYLVDREAVTRVGADPRDAAVAFGAQHILHLHRFDDGERLAGFHLLALLDDDRRKQARHRRQQQARGVRRLLLRHQRKQLGTPRRQHLGAAYDAAMHQPECRARQTIDLD